MTAASPRHFLVGGGVASLAAAVFLVRDAGVRGGDIRIFEQTRRLGGSLDGSGGPDEGYLVRGGRMFEPHFACTFDLLASIPSPDAPGRSVRDDIDIFNREVVGASHCRLVRDGRRADMSRFGLRRRDLLDLTRMTFRSEASLAGATIEHCFDAEFFDSNFWVMWSTTFAFQPWHSAIEMRRYLKRFIHLLPGFRQLRGILRTRYNQYDSMIAPIIDWLTARGVAIETGTQVTDVEIERANGRRCVTALLLAGDGGETHLPVSAQDRVYLTLGSMTQDSTRGSNAAPPPEPMTMGGAWSLWRRLAARDPAFGRPDAFCGDTAATRWESFTVTLRNPSFFAFMEAFTGNIAGTGGLVTFAGSGWTLSIVLFHPPHFRGQPDDAFVFWGYGLRGERPGDFVRKPMAACGGDEIIEELAGHLRLGERAAEMFRGAIVIPCMMPFITSQFMPRRAGDRPAVRPDGAENFAVMGQFCEQPRDTVFTVEYSVRSAMSAVHALTGRGRPPPAVRRTDLSPAVLWRAARALLEG